MKIILSKEITRAQKEYRKHEERMYQLEAIFDRAMEKAGCVFCPIYIQQYEKESFEKRFYNCGNCAHKERVSKAFREYLPLLVDEDPSLKAYAKAVYEMLSTQKPTLFHIKEKRVYQWDQVFPASFESIDKDMYETIVALVDSDLFGFYSIK